MKRRAGVLTFMLILASFAGFQTNAAAETVRVDIDGDKVRDKVVANSPAAGVTRVKARLSSRRNKVVSLDLQGSAATAPYIRVKADVNRGRGAELFVRFGRYDTVDTIAVLTMARGKLVNARNFFVNGNLSDGLAVGIKCGRVGGGPGIRNYVFRLGSRGRWNRFVASYAWKKGRLVERGRTKERKVVLPPRSQTGIGCPKPKDPPEPPPVLGRPGNRFLSGLGTVKPKTFSAKQGKGLYFGFKWRGWGNPRATANGYFTTGPGTSRKRMSLTAFDLGPCGGKQAYRRLTLKPRGQNGITLNVC